MTIEIQRVIPLLRIFDERKAREFYLDFLGFTVEWEHRFDASAPLYMQVSRNGLSLHLTEHHGDCCPGSTIFLWMTGLDEFHQEISERKYGYMRPGIEQTFYEARCMEVVDACGNKLRFHETLHQAGQRQ